ncbi:Echinoderm microtubule-associated protein-like 5 [Echinococcus granulosus]|uniref:Cilia- and flagella-associated protein 251 n=1 Tax=Echinococcus granulosus TaxID=6210 RepID=A0A068W880_ECHGR|nr:Echinoderm microtubule-associated protein-like 5 [Echinococcus granulosus]CDS15686.1 WD repeat containing protein 66 [Echinococcus granulosus]
MRGQGGGHNFAKRKYLPPKEGGLKNLYLASDENAVSRSATVDISTEDMGISLCFQMLVKDTWGPDDYLDGGPPDKEYQSASMSTELPAKEKEQKRELSVLSCAREALKPVRVFSFNHHVPVINLSDGMNFCLFFVSGHLAVIYDVKKNAQHILRGHVNTIVCACASKDRRWLSTGDRGPDSAVIVWDARSRTPVRCLFTIHRDGVMAVRLSPDARYLATLSADPTHQVLAVWDWTSSAEHPLCFTQLESDKLGVQAHIAFRSDNYFQAMSNSETHVVFYDWTLGGCMTSHSPPLCSSTFRTNYGKFVMSAYVPDTDMAITATNRGYIVVWEKSRWTKKDLKKSPCFRAATKLIPLHQIGITFLTITSCVSSRIAIVTGDESGQIRFSDSDFNLLHWHHDLKSGPISSVSFAETGLFNECSVFEKFGLEESSAQNSHIDTLDPRVTFATEDFLISTSQAIILSLQIEGKVLLERDQCATINGISSHPFRDLITTVGHSGMIKTWNYKWLVPVRTRMLENQQLNSCAFDPYGGFLAVGCTSGRVIFLDAITLDDTKQPPFDYAKGIVKKIAFSSDSTYCAYIDTQHSTTLLRRKSTCNSLDRGWVFSGRYRAHGDNIVDILFKTCDNNATPRLFTLGEDRMLIEYDVLSAKHNVLPLKRRIQVEHIAKPQCFTSMGDFYSENFICYANSDSKFRLFDVDALAIRKTVMAPVKGAPFVRLATLPEKDDFPSPPCTPTVVEKPSNKSCLVFLTNEQLGLVLVPLDGDPYKAANIVAHPCKEHGTGYTSDLAVSRDFRFIFTAGGPANAMHMWRADPGVLVSQTYLYCNPMQPFYDMLTAEELNDMKDYFYLSLLRVQGISCTHTRLTSYTIPITEIPYLTRAMGLFVADADIENMMNEIKYSRFGSTGRYVTEFDFDTFVKLFVNYRVPYDGVSLSDIQAAFMAIVEAAKPHEPHCPFYELCGEYPEPKLQQTSLLRLLQTVGEPIRHDELVEALAVLLGLAPIAGKVEDACAMKELEVSKEIEDRLLTCIEPREFYRTLLAMDACDSDPPELSNFRRQADAKPLSSTSVCHNRF